MLDRGQLQHHITALKSRDESVRREAIQSLKHYPDADWASVPNDVVRPLVESLRQQLPKTQPNGTKPPNYRQEVVIILGNIGPRAECVLPQLMDLLEEGVPDGIREAAATALGKMGREARVAVDKLIQVLQVNCRMTLAARVARALGEIGCADQRVRSALTSLWLLPLHPQNNQLQVALAMCKLKIDARGLLPNLTTTLVTNRDSSLRKAAAEALAWCSKNDLDVVPALTAALHDDDDEVKRLAEEGLTQLRLSHDKALQLCALQLKDSICAETALRKNGARSVPALAKALESDDPLTREKAARTLGCFHEAAVDAVPGLLDILDDKQREVRLAAAKALWQITKTPDKVVPVLAELLSTKGFANDPPGKDARRSFLQSVIESLCRIGPAAQDAVPALLKSAKDENRLIRESALRALREISPAAAKKAEGR